MSTLDDFLQKVDPIWREAYESGDPNKLAGWGEAYGTDTRDPNWSTMNTLMRYKQRQLPAPDRWKMMMQKKIDFEKAHAAKINAPYEGRWQKQFDRGWGWLPEEGVRSEREQLEMMFTNPSSKMYDPTSEFFNQNLYNKNWAEQTVNGRRPVVGDHPAEFTGKERALKADPPAGVNLTMPVPRDHSMPPPNYMPPPARLPDGSLAERPNSYWGYRRGTSPYGVEPGDKIYQPQTKETIQNAPPTGMMSPGTNQNYGLTITPKASYTTPPTQTFPPATPSYVSPSSATTQPPLNPVGNSAAWRAQRTAWTPQQLELQSRGMLQP